MVKTKLFRVLLPVSDIDAAAKFYTSVLGMAGVRVSDGRHYFDCDGVILACFDPRADGDGYDAVANPEWFYFGVSDLEGTLAACKAGGARRCDDDVPGSGDGEIATRPWGERSFYVRDPFGNKVCFVDEGTVFTGS